MQNKIIISGIVIVVVAVIAFFGFNQKNNQPQNESPEANLQNEIQSDNNNFSGTVFDLMGKSDSSKCVAEFNLDGQIQNQTIYFDGQNKRMRFETQTNVDGKQANVFVVVKDDWEYIWSEGDFAGMIGGMKMKFSDMDRQTEETDNTMEAGGIDIDQVMDFSCSPWMVDASLFELPAGVEFTDIAAQTEQLMQAMPQDACAMCDMMPTEELKAQCHAGCAE